MSKRVVMTLVSPKMALLYWQKPDSGFAKSIMNSREGKAMAVIPSSFYLHRRLEDRKWIMRRGR
jgi:hypothetical protein